MKKLEPTHTHIASHLIAIGALTPLVIRMQNLDTVIRVPINETPEYYKALDVIGFISSDDPFRDLEVITSIKKPRVICSTPMVDRIYQHMISKSMWVNLYGGWNIVYLEGATIAAKDFVANNDELDMWNDLRIIFRFTEKGSEHYSWRATTEPGRYYTNNPMSPRGAARIAFGQQRCWVEGYHLKKQIALVQNSSVLLYRDLDKNGLRTNDAVELCNKCGINHHTTESEVLPSIGRWSAGCLVGESKTGHNKFMTLIRKDYRNHAGYEFLATVLDASKII
jgi:hypothetical protein